MPRLVLTLLGGFEARLGSGQPLKLPAKAQALLAYLVLAPMRTHPRDKLAALLWGEVSPAQARDSLRHTLASVLRALGDAAPVLHRDGQTITVDPAPVDLDVARFARLAAEDSVESLERAAALYRGDLLEGLSVAEPPFEEWLLAERERLRELAVDALATLLARHSRAGATDRALPTAARLVALEPLQEVVHRTLMRLYAAQGRRGAALRQYQLCVSVLRRELGVDPEPDTQRLYREILSGLPLTPAPREGVHRSADVAHAETPLVGRQPERAQLERAIAGARDGRAQVVTIVGEAGIGKTRLVAELAAHAIERGFRVRLGRSFETTQILPFGPWSQVLRAAVDGEPLDDLDPVWRGELARLLPEIGRPELPPSSGDTLRLFESVAMLVARLAAARPLVLVIEDLHWADDMTLRLFAFLTRRLAEAPLVLCGTAREEDVAHAPALRAFLAECAGQAHAVHLAPRPLSEADTSTLVRALARGGSDDDELERTTGRVWTASEGNPFVIVEALSALGDGPAPAEWPLPDRVRQLVGDRLARLSDAGRQLIAVAAVIGREFEFPLLRQASGLGEAAAVDAIEELVRRRVLHSLGERFDFTHDRVRDVAYAQLLPPRRRLLHAQVAAALHALHGADLDPHAATLGAHYRESQDWAQSAAWFRRAGVQAAAHAAHREAVVAYEQALAAIERLPESRATMEAGIDLRFDLRSSLFTLGDHRRVAGYLRDAEALATRLGDRRRHGWALRYVSNHFWITGDLRRALDAADRGRALAASLDDFDLRTATAFTTAQVHHARGEYRAGVDLLRPIVGALDGPRLRERFGFHSPLSVLARTWLAWCLGETGAFMEGIRAGEQALEIADGFPHPEPGVAARIALGQVLMRQGALARAIPLIEAARELAQRGRLAVWSAGVSMWLGAAYGLDGRVREAVALLEPGPWRERPYFAERATILGGVYLRAGRIDEARELATLAVDGSAKSDEQGRRAWAMKLLGDVVAANGARDPEAAASRYRTAMELAAGLGMRPLVAHCRFGLGTLAADRGAARTELSEAAGLYREMSMTAWADRAEAALASA